MRLRILSTSIGVLALTAGTSFAQTLPCHPGPANNGGSAGWALFLDLDSASGVTVTHLSTANTGTAGAAFSVEMLGSSEGVATEQGIRN